MNAVPAYGKDYRSMDEVRTAFDQNADFRVNDVCSQWHGKYFNKRNAEQHGIQTVYIRFDKLSKVVGINLIG